MSNLQQESSLDESVYEENFKPDTPTEKSYEKDLYKKWFRSKTQSGFISIRPWFAGMKFRIDIGKISADGKLAGNTNVFVDAVDFGAWLKAITAGTAKFAYPANAKTGVVTDEGFVSYGGAEVQGKPISRIFKVHYWQSGETFDTDSFVFKTGHFNAKKTDSGAFLPDMKSPISVDSIKVTRQELYSISYLVDLALISHVANKKDWYEV
jgi:hypothetical protein